ncbi:MAG TPA: chemotaxis protein CheW [Cyanobacteria bacterium UBA8803]|nr:chemotaxis protein CheW [Cyanobacteria bacterium UBA9273]HBL58486.1 chemotaxis protein CheW [Cyanobacteria bacterium UBA8803]
MNNLLVNSRSHEIVRFQQPQTTRSLKLIVFKIGDLNLALQIESVYKVVDRTPIYSSGINHIGVAHLGDREITVFDLHWHFFKTSQIRAPEPGGYIVILQNTPGELYGIPVAETPALIEMPLSAIRLLPESYRRADTLKVARHVAVIPQAGASTTIFLLDVDLLLPILQQVGTLEK